MGRLRERPNRLRSRTYLNTVRGKPCLCCGSPGEAHHLTFAQPRAMASKTGDQYTVPLCHSHHMELHQDGLGERTWWAVKGIDPMVWAENNYRKWEKENGSVEQHDA